MGNTLSSPPRRAHRAVPIVLGFAFFMFYFLAGRQMLASPVYERDDVFFRADTERALRDITGTRQMNHGHTTGHPNFVLFHAPLGSWLGSSIKGLSVGMKTKEASQRASHMLTSSAGALTVVAFYGLLVACGLARSRACLFAAVLGFSAVHVFYAAVPETYIFSALGLTVVAWLSLRPGSSSFSWALAAVYAWSALTSNVVTIGLWALARFYHPSWMAWFKKTSLALGAVFLAMLLLSFAQKAIYPKTNLFFMPHAVAEESGWLTAERLSDAAHSSKILSQHLFVSNIVAPEPVATTVFAKPMGSIEQGTWETVAPAAPLVLLWSAFLVGSGAALCFRQFYRPGVLVALAVLGFNFAFFFIFGHDRMLYAALWTSMTVFLVAASTEFWLQRWPRLIPAVSSALVALIVGLAWHHCHFLGKLVRLIPS